MMNEIASKNVAFNGNIRLFKINGKKDLLNLEECVNLKVPHDLIEAQQWKVTYDRSEAVKHK